MSGCVGLFFLGIEGLLRLGEKHISCKTSGAEQRKKLVGSALVLGFRVTSCKNT